MMFVAGIGAAAVVAQSAGGADAAMRSTTFTTRIVASVPRVRAAKVTPSFVDPRYRSALATDAGSANPLIGIFGPATQTAKASVQVATSGQGRALFAVSAGDHHLYVAPQNDGVITEYGYPSGGCSSTSNSRPLPRLVVR